MTSIIRHHYDAFLDFSLADRLWLDSDGLHIGGSRHAHLQGDWPDAGETADTRLDVFLAVAFRKRFDTRQLSCLQASSALSRNGDHAGANIRLAIGGLMRIPFAANLAERLDMADALLDEGLTPNDLLNALYLGARSDFHKRYDPGQPRVPAGNGRRSGQFGSNGDTPTTSWPPVFAAGAVFMPAMLGTATNAVALAAPEWSLLSPAVSAAALASLSTFAIAIGAAATFGALFVPSPNFTSSRGVLPGTTSHTYDYNDDGGVLRVADGTGTIVAAGQKDRSGIFHDADTGVPFARAVDGAIVFDAAAIEKTDISSRSTTQVDVDKHNGPRLCPPASPEVDTKASPRAKAYQQQINLLIRPTQPLPLGWTPAFLNPVTGRWVRPDNCDEDDGSLIEAKGPGHDGLLTFPKGRISPSKSFLEQATRQVEAAKGRRVRWYFAEEKTAAFASNLFSSRPELVGIEINFMEALIKWI